MKITTSVEMLNRSVKTSFKLFHCNGTPWRLLSINRNKISFQSFFHNHVAKNNIITTKRKSVHIPKCNLNEFIWRDLEKWSERTAVICGVTERSYTYHELHKACRSLAASFKNKLHLEDGDHVAIMLPNMPEFVIALLGSIKAGCIVTTVNPNYTANEISHQLKHCKVKAVITTTRHYSEVKKSIETLKRDIVPIVTTFFDDAPIPEDAIRFQELIGDYKQNYDCLKECNRESEDTVLVPYSSGTTGLPKGVELTHRNIIANCCQLVSEDLNLFHPTTDAYQDIIICVLPFFHIYGLLLTLISKIALGHKLITLPKFQPDTYLHTLEKYRSTVMYIVPPIALFLASHPKVTREHFASVRNMMSGAAPLAATDVERLMKKADNAQTNFVHGYGLTETLVVAMEGVGSNNHASVGWLTPNTECKFVDLDDENKTLGLRQEGELWVRGPQVMKGYYNNPMANSEVFRPQCWLRTGDIGYFDENEHIYITDRLKELIKVKGFQVAPAELEGLLRSHPELEDAAVVGVPHQQYGEIPKGFVVKKPGCSSSPRQIMDFVAERVTAYKRLGDVTFVDAIPKSAAGKILRREIKKKFI